MPDPTLFDSIQNSIISDGIIDNLTPIAIHRLSLTCKVAKEVVSSYKRCTWNINTCLARFFEDPVAFRSLQARTGTVITAGLATEFFSRTFSRTTAMEIIVPINHALEVGKWIMNIGYVFLPCSVAGHQHQDLEKNLIISNENIVQLLASDDVNGLFDGIAAVCTFVRVDANGSITKIRMMVSASSIFKYVFNLPTTFFMNVITFNKAYALYPRAGFEYCRGLITQHEPGSEGLDAVANLAWRERGWKIDEAPLPGDEALYPECSRWVGDKFCWTISLPLDDLDVAPASQILPVELNGWSLVPTARDPGNRWPNKEWKAKCLVLRSPTLKHLYCFPMTSFWLDFSRECIALPTDEDVMYDDAAVKTHVEFCRKFANNVDAVIVKEQKSHHRTLVSYKEELQGLEKRIEASEKKLELTEGLVQRVGAMQEKIDDQSQRVLDFLTVVEGWVRRGTNVETFPDTVAEFAQAVYNMSCSSEQLKIRSTTDVE